MRESEHRCIRQRDQGSAAPHPSTRQRSRDETASRQSSPERGHALARQQPRATANWSPTGSTIAASIPPLGSHGQIHPWGRRRSVLVSAENSTDECRGVSGRGGKPGTLLDLDQKILKVVRAHSRHTRRLGHGSRSYSAELLPRLE